MKSRMLLVAYALLTLQSGQAAAGSREIGGQVIDQHGRPVARAEVSRFWYTEPDADLRGSKMSDLLRANDPVLTDHEGRFEGSFAVPRERPIGLMAMDAEKSHGGIAIISNELDSSCTITLEPLVEVSARFVAGRSGVPLEWTNVYVRHMPERVRVYGCPSERGDVRMLLPPGEYELWMYGHGTKGRYDPLTITDGAARIDLGTIDLAPSNVALHIGQPPPAWTVTDARDVPKSIQIADLRGKWVIIEFWGYWCAPCVSNSLPRLMAFYEEHHDLREHFEILAFHVRGADSIADLDRHLAPIERDIWDGRKLPFPILLDASEQTAEDWGLSSYPTVVLINPEGHLVKLDGKTVEAALRKELDTLREDPPGE